MPNQSYSTRQFQVGIGGLNTNGNSIRAIPGQLQVATDVVFMGSGTVGNRLGFNRLLTAANNIDALIEYAGSLLVHQSDQTLWLLDDDGDSLSQIGSGFQAPTGGYLRNTIAQGSLFTTTSTGVQKMTAANSAPTSAGRAQAPNVAASLTATGGYLSGSSNVAYAALWSRTDANNVLVMSAPSRPFEIGNSSRASVTSITRSSSTATVTTTAAHGLSSGNTVFISGANEANYDGSFAITVTGATTFTYTVIGSPATPATGSINFEIKQNAVVTVVVPFDATSGDSWEVYRTPSTADISEPPGSDMYRVLSGTYTNPAISSATFSAGTVTITTAVAHGLIIGDTIYVSGFTQSPYNGLQAITGVTSTTLTYAISGSPASPATGPGVLRIISFTATDSTPDTSLITPLYTNESEDGAGQQNDRPPMALDVETSQLYTWYASTSQPQQIEIKLLGTANVTAGVSTITFSNLDSSQSETYTADSAEAVPTRHFKVTTAGTASQQITATMQSLVNVINRQYPGIYAAQYMSGPDDDPGLILVQKRLTSDVQFRITVNSTATGNSFTPILPTSGTTVASDGQAMVNRMYWSKLNQPEHVPAFTNFLDVGRRGYAIQRIAALRNSMFVFKQGDGIYMVTGQPPNWTVTELDKSKFLAATQSLAKLDNQIFVFTNAGVCAVNENGAVIISDSITPDLNAARLLSNLESLTFAASHSTDHQYLLFLPSQHTDTTATRAFVFDVLRGQELSAQAWLNWSKPARAALVRSTDYTLYLGGALEKTLLGQRRTGTESDYQDETVAATIISVPSTTTAVVTLTTTALGVPTDGWALQQGSVVAKTKSVSRSGTQYTLTFDSILTGTSALTTGACTLLTPITMHVLLEPLDCGYPEFAKSFLDIDILLRYATASQVWIEIGSNESGMNDPIQIVRAIPGGWGLDPWGEFPWGGTQDPVQSIPYRENVPINSQTGETLAVGIYHHVATESAKLLNVAVIYRMISEITATDPPAS